MARLSAGRVKTCASQESVESFSLLPSSYSRRQNFWLSDSPNREELSTRKLNAGVFAQPRWIPALGTRGFHRPLSDPSTDLQVRCHGSERDGREALAA